MSFVTPPTSSITGGQSSDQNDILAAIQRMEQNFTSSINAVSPRVDELSERVQGTAMLEVETSSKSILWADRTDLVANLPPLPRWPDDEEDDENSGEIREAFEVSESTSALLKKSFTSTLPHVERCKLRGMFHVPIVDETRCPRLDSIFKTAGWSLKRRGKSL